MSIKLEDGYKVIAKMRCMVVELEVRALTFEVDIMLFDLEGSH